MRTLFKLLVFLLPAQLGYHFWPEWSYLFGIRVDYLSPTIYLTETILWFLLALFLYRTVVKKNQALSGFVKLLPFFLLLALANLVFATSFAPALVKWVKIFEVAFLVAFVARQKNFDFKAWVVEPLTLSVLFFSTVGIIQVVLGRTIGGLLYFLGERSFLVSTPGIATTTIFGETLLRAYSTFSHPNSLAGFLGVAILLIAFNRDAFEKFSWLKLAAVLVGIVCLILTFSLAGITALVVALLLLLIRKKSPNLLRVTGYLLFWLVVIASLTLPILAKNFLVNVQDDESLTRRLSLARTAGQLISEKPIFGIGINNFIIKLPQKNDYPSISWWLQPVHNTFLLVFVETGLVGLIPFILILFSALRKTLTRPGLFLALVFIVLTGSLDHYWLTLQQNFYLLGLVLGLSFRNGKD